MGFSTREWELLKGNDGDLTCPSVQRPIRQMAMRGQILSAFLAPPCGSFSLINRSVRRSKDDPWGLLLQESDKSRASVNLGNGCMKSAIRIIGWLEKNHVPWILEHPMTSRAWFLPFFHNFTSEASHCSTRFRSMSVWNKLEKEYSTHMFED